MAYNYPQRLALISKQTASSSSSLSFTSGISSDFSTYYVKIRNIVPATNATSLVMTFSTNGGSSYLSSGYLNANCNVNYNVQSTYSTTGTSSIIIATTLSNTSTYPLNGEIILYDLDSGTFVPKCTYHNTCYNSSTYAQTIYGGGMNTGTTAVNAISFAMASGNITSGTISLYGIQEGGFLY